MGKGTDMAGLDHPEHAAMIDDLKDQLLIAFLKRLGGKITMTVEEVDATGSHNFALSFKDGLFTFQTEAKH